MLEHSRIRFTFGAAGPDVLIAVSETVATAHNRLIAAEPWRNDFEEVPGQQHVASRSQMDGIRTEEF